MNGDFPICRLDEAAGVLAVGTLVSTRRNRLAVRRQEAENREKLSKVAKKHHEMEISLKSITNYCQVAEGAKPLKKLPEHAKIYHGSADSLKTITNCQERQS